MSLTFYYHPLSSFCHKALIALYENGVEFEKRLVNLGDEADRTELSAKWPLCKFPVIHDPVRDRNIPEATIIIEYLDHHFAGRRPLIPVDWQRALDVRLWDRILDNHVHLPMQALVSDHVRGKHGDMTRERSAIRTAYAMIDTRMASRTWLASDDFSLADCAAAPALFYASTLEPLDDFDHLKTYFDKLTQRPSYQRVLEEAKPFFAMYPLADSIPARFRS